MQRMQRMVEDADRIHVVMVLAARACRDVQQTTLANQRLLEQGQAGQSESSPS